MVNQVLARLSADALRDMSCCSSTRIPSKGVSMSLDAYTEMVRDQGIFGGAWVAEVST